MDGRVIFFEFPLWSNHKERGNMKPNDEQLLGLLIKLLAEQENVKITYQVEKGEK